MSSYSFFSLNHMPDVFISSQPDMPLLVVLRNFILLVLFPRNVYMFILFTSRPLPCTYIGWNSMIRSRNSQFQGHVKLLVVLSVALTNSPVHESVIVLTEACVGQTLQLHFSTWLLVKLINKAAVTVHILVFW